MKVHLAATHEAEHLWVSTFHDRARSSKMHQVVANPVDADLIMLLGVFGMEPARLLGHPIYRTFPDRCAVYNEEDAYLPLVPGIYCSARRDEHSRIGRVFSYAYISRNGRHHNPFLAEVSGERVIQAAPARRFLFSFQGGSTSMVRKRLFNLSFGREDVLIENTSSFHNWDGSQPGRRERQLRYAETIASSHFVLCPRGAGTGSIRFFEVMASGVAPVLISDDYELPVGPAWDEFLIRVAERDIARLPMILEGYVATAEERGRLAQRAFVEYFSIEHEFDQVVGLASRSLRHAGPSEEQFRRRQPAMIRRAERRRKVRQFFRTAALKLLHGLRLKNPYQMNR